MCVVILLKKFLCHNHFAVANLTSKYCAVYSRLAFPLPQYINRDYHCLYLVYGPSFSFWLKIIYTLRPFMGSFAAFFGDWCGLAAMSHRLYWVMYQTSIFFKCDTFIQYCETLIEHSQFSIKSIYPKFPLCFWKWVKQRPLARNVW